MNFLTSNIQKLLNVLGYEMRRKQAGVSYTDAYIEQKRLLSGHDVKVIFEVGAADGRDCSRYTELFPNSDVFAFEPNPESFEKLLKVCTSNSRVHGVRSAMSDAEGAATFHIGVFGDASSLYQARDTGSTFDKYNASRSSIEVPVGTISSFAKSNGINKIDILKMDAQGAELDILKGAEDMLDEGNIGLVYTEVQFLQLYHNVPQFDKIMTYLLDRDYSLHNLYSLISNQSGRLSWGDAIFVHKSWEGEISSEQ